MPIGLGELVVIGLVGATIIVGPKNILPKLAETIKTARSALGNEAAQATKTAAKEASKKTKPPSPPSQTS
eukprot:m.164954 g.164954  ORF g.164954 m.164954 type:complete len:70 (-) comp13430_c0_seq3:1077-1286(-)